MQAVLVDRARHGDVEAFGQLAEGHVRRLRTVAWLILRDHDLAEDAVQEALVRCWRQLPKLRDIERFDAWLTRILVRAASDEAERHRRFRAGVREIAMEPAEAGGIPAVGDREQLDRGFRRLSVEHRAVVVLHHYADMTLSEIAAALDVRPGTIRSRYHYAIATLRAELEADERWVRPEEASA